MAAKRVKLTNDNDERVQVANDVDDDDERLDDLDDSEDDLDGLDNDNDSEENGSDSDDDDDDDDEIIAANEDAHSKQKKKRKRALPQQAFGSLLSSLIAAPAPTKPLRPLHPAPAAEALERKARKQLQAHKHEREERGHVSDVIAGWGPRPQVPFSQWSRLDASASASASVEEGAGGAERERELRRLAQRGAVRLFNAIKAAQTTEADVLANGGRVAAIKQANAADGTRSIKEASPAASIVSASSAATKAAGAPVSRQPNMLGSRGKQEALANLSKASFLELFKTGTAKPKVAI